MENYNLNHLIELRREIHRNPELGYNEVQTAKLIMKELDWLGIAYVSGAAGTGVVAEIKKGKGKCVVLRADMDALPIEEEADVDFKSENKGIMHACGHDIHTTMLLGACAYLKDLDFNGTLRFIFQPSEESVINDHENKSGGQRIIEEGFLDNVDYVIALHVYSLLDVGTLAFIPGQALACTSTFTIEVKGKAGHAGAAPHLAIDAVLIASDLIQSLHHIVSRNISPTQPGVISITKIHGGIASNIIADKVLLGGTIRSLDLDNFNIMIGRMKKIIAGVALSYETEIDLKFELFYPSLLNNMELNNQLKPIANQIFKPFGLIEMEPSLGGEDFAFYSRKVPSVFYFIGARDNKEPVYFLHDSKVVLNEDCIALGVEFLAKSALHLLDNK